MNTYDDELEEDLLRHYFERELEYLRRDLRAFAKSNPEAAARLSINSDGRSDDPGIERLVQSTAILNARHIAKIDDDYPEVSEALIQRTYPQYLRPFPSCSVVQFDIEGIFEGRTELVRIARGTRLRTKLEKCDFRTAHDVVLAPLQIARAHYASSAAAPQSVQLPRDMTGMLSIGFASAIPGASLNGAAPDTLRVHIAGQPAMVAALIDTLLLRTSTAYVEDGTGRWIALPVVPLTAAGFGPQDWLFTDAKEPGQPFGLLGEYCSFAQRFHFVDIDFAALRSAATGGHFTLHLSVDGAPPGSRIGLQLAQLHADHLKLFCSPVVNLFANADVAVAYDSGAGIWPIQVQEKDDALTEVWSVDRVRTEQGIDLPSSSALITHQAISAPPRWTLLQRTGYASRNAVRPAALSLAGASGQVKAGAELGPLRVAVTCSNGDLPRSLVPGAPEGDLRIEGMTPIVDKIMFLQVPTAVRHLPRAKGELWRLIGQQTPHALKMSQEGLPDLKQLLKQFAALSPAQGRHIDGITSLSHRSVMTLMMRSNQPAMVRGIEITLELEEQLFAANSVAVFAGVMEHFFAPYAPANSFVQLVVNSASGATLWRGEPVRGMRPLL